MLIKLSRATRYLGALLNVGGSGGGGFIYPDSADRPFADVAARNTWAAANTGDLVSSSTVVLIDGAPQVWYLWTGATNPGTVGAALWVDATPLIQGPAGADGTETDFSTVGAYELMMPDASFNPIPAGARRLENGTGDFEFDATVIVPQESLQIGFGGVLSALGAVPLFRSFVTGRRGTFPFTYYGKVTGTDRTVEVDAADSERVEVQPVDTGTTTTGGTVQMSATTAEIINGIVMRPSNTVTVGGFLLWACGCIISTPIN